jgi:SAM-dependent methyltransferase
VLVICGGPKDRDVFHGLGFTRVTISNLDVRMKGDEYAPFAWSFQDAEDLKFPDNSFDFAVVHSGLHHCYSPHRAMIEMYRVARRGILAFEPRDTFLVRLGVRLNFGQEYEVASVGINDMQFGGVRNSTIPNYVYRWTESEIEKTMNCYAAVGRPRFHYFYALRPPQRRLNALKNRFVAGTVRALLPLLRVFTAVFPKQCNNFAWSVEKVQLPAGLHPWLTLVDGQPTIRKEWILERYGSFKKKEPATKKPK